MFAFGIVLLDIVCVGHTFGACVTYGWPDCFFLSRILPIRWRTEVLDGFQELM